MLTQNKQYTAHTNNLLSVQKIRVEKLYGIYLDAMKTAFDEGNHYIQHSLANGSADLESALKIRSNHINSVAKKYEEFNIGSLARFFNVSADEIKSATSLAQR
ncbi:MAG: hypothetical protein ACC653_11455 [Gammaproteobacteria bacterium]